MANILRKTLIDAARIAQAPTCADLLAYRLTLAPILERIIGDEMMVVHLEVDRDDVFHRAVQFYKATNKQSKHQRISVTFKTDGQCEKGIDGAGLRREFYSIFFKECLLQKDMFVGRPRKRFPSNDMEMIRGGYFEALGRAIVASILNGDCGFPYLAPAVFFYLVDEDYTNYLNLDDVPDENIKALGKEILSAKSDASLTKIINTEAGVVIEHIGWPSGRAITLETRDALVQQLVQWSMIDKRKRSLDCLTTGLNHMNFLEATKSNPKLLPLLVFSTEYSVTAEYVQRKFIPLLEKLTCKSTQEKNARDFMIQYIKEVKDEEASWLFQFLTGMDDPPVEEEEIKIEINALNPAQTMLEAVTCNTTLRIPQGNKNFTDFKKSDIKLQDMRRTLCYQWQYET